MIRQLRKKSLLSLGHEAAIAVEFALILPFVLFLGLGGFELTRYIQAHQKIMNAAMTLTDVITQSQYLSNAELMGLIGSTPNLIAPLNAGNLVVTVTSMSYLGPPSVPGPYTIWQRSTANTGTISIISPPPSTQPNTLAMNGFTFGPRDQLLAVEIFYNYQSATNLPLTQFLLPGGNQIYKYALFRPRYGALISEPQ